MSQVRIVKTNSDTLYIVPGGQSIKFVTDSTVAVYNGPAIYEGGDEHVTGNQIALVRMTEPVLAVVVTAD